VGATGTALAGKVALISGGGSGMGREIALAYAEAGAQVVVSSDVPDRDQAVAGECRELGADATALSVDVRDEHGVAGLVSRCLEEFGRLDVLVAAAGVDVTDVDSPEARFVHRLSYEQWKRVIDVNLTGVFLAMRAVLPWMMEAKAGSILSFSSGTVRFPVPGLAPYISSKFALEGLTKVLAQEVDEYGIRVNTIQPGGVTDTALLPGWIDPEYRARMHRPSVVRALAVYLAGDESRFVTGRSLVAAEWNKERGLVLCPCEACSTRDPRQPVEWRGLTAL
jgi:3-oxoacyl-[acyl-carrier protein] reductase